MTRIKDIALAPYWALQLATKAKSFRANPLIGSRLLNRWGLHAGRRVLAARMAARRREGLAADVSPQERAQFEAQGYFIRHGALPPGLFAAVRAEAAALCLPAREMRQGPTVTRRIGLDDDALDRLPALAAIVRDAGIRGLIRYAASYGGEPTFQVQSVIAEPGRGGEDPQTRLHADTFHPTAKAWLFLDDVGEADGPFAYVPGSHRLTPQRLAWEREHSLTARDSADQMHSEGSFRAGPDDLDRLGLPRPVAMAVPANTLIVADTSGFHARTASPRATHRVEIYATLRRTPFLPWTGGHPLALPGIAGRHSGLETALQARLEAWRLGRSVWRPVGLVNPYDPARI